MPDSIWPYLGDIHQAMHGGWAGAICCAAAVLAGALIGFERQRARKPTGLRTHVLLCLGSAIFTQTSLLLVGPNNGDPSRIAAQIVTGIGFLGAGAILREGGIVLGVTTAAGIWATAAVGVMLGGGYVAPGLALTLLILMVLSASKAIDRVVMGACRMGRLRIVLDGPDDRTLIRVKSILDGFSMDLTTSIHRDAADRHVVHLDYCNAHLEHRAFLEELVNCEGILEMRIESTESAPRLLAEGAQPINPK
ncbi:MAG TPA: MgtC/SapB family protein [Phycisphaerae bacterium]|nr:MgtC/SapB family protein [Phycisphaerae bacterium]